MDYQIRRGRAAEWEDILRSTEAAFGYDKGHLTAKYPHAYPGPEART